MHPRAKRAFAGASADPAQRQITFFFSTATASVSSDSSPPSPAAAAPPSRLPLLPATVQANLLSVGMRVRKSVPEGYKTTGHSLSKLWADSNAPSAVSAAPPAAVSGRRAPRAMASSAATHELLPFCGINRVGGLAVQPFPPALDELADQGDDKGGGDDGVPDLDAIPGLTLSQESDVSNPPTPSRKRFFDVDDANAWDHTVNLMPDCAPAISTTQRVKAVPRRRILGRDVTCTSNVDQDNMTVDGDFEEVDFLVCGDGREMDLSQ